MEIQVCDSTRSYTKLSVTRLGLVVTSQDTAHRTLYPVVTLRNMLLKSKWESLHFGKSTAQKFLQCKTLHPKPRMMATRCSISHMPVLFPQWANVHFKQTKSKNRQCIESLAEAYGATRVKSKARHQLPKWVNGLSLWFSITCILNSTLCIQEIWKNSWSMAFTYHFERLLIH